MQALLSRQERSGQSLAEFARRRSIPASRLRWWRLELKRRAASRARLRKRPRPGTPQLVPLSIALDGASPPRDFVLEIPTGARLRIPPGASSGDLERILQVLWPSC